MAFSQALENQQKHLEGEFDKIFLHFKNWLMDNFLNKLSVLKDPLDFDNIEIPLTEPYCNLSLERLGKWMSLLNDTEPRLQFTCKLRPNACNHKYFVDHIPGMVYQTPFTQPTKLMYIEICKK